MQGNRPRQYLRGSRHVFKCTVNELLCAPILLSIFALHGRGFSVEYVFSAQSADSFSL